MLPVARLTGPIPIRSPAGLAPTSTENQPAEFTRCVNASISAGFPTSATLPFGFPANNRLGQVSEIQIPQVVAVRTGRKRPTCCSAGRRILRRRDPTRSAGRRSQGSSDTAGKVVPAGTVAVVRSSDFLRASERATALATLIRQRRLAPSCGGQAPIAERTVGPARTAESLTPRSGIREHNRPLADAPVGNCRGSFWGVKRTRSDIVLLCEWLLRRPDGKSLV